MEHNTSGVNNTPDVNGANNIGKEVKIYKSNLF